MKQKKKRLKTYRPCCSLRRQKGVRLQSGETKVTDLQYYKVILVKGSTNKTLGLRGRGEKPPIIE